MKKTVVILYIVVVAVMAAATIIESYHGTEYVAQNIYGAWWFSALWALLAAATIFWFVKRRVRRPSVVALHLSFIVILAGALLTHLTAVRGVVPLRKGIPDNQYLTSDMRLHQLPFTLRLDDFEIKYYEGSNDPSDYISHITIDDQPVTISMNHIATRSGIRLYQMDYDPDLQGSILAMNSDPWGIPVTYAGYALLFVSLLWMLLDPKGGFRSQLSTLRGRRYWLLAVLLLAVYALLLYHFLGKYSAANHPLPVLNSWLLPVHVSTIIMAYLLLFVAIFVRAMLYPALAFLSYGIFIGAIWANQSWGNYWSWDPKETWALITLMVYAVPLHGSLFRSARNLQFSARRAKRDACYPLELVRLPEQERDARIFNFQSSIKLYRLYMSLAFLVILMTYLGVNYLLGGMHSYA